MAELVSILIPAYNAEKWIRDTIKSALSQTWPNKEIIIVDDGSTDNTLQIAREFQSKSVKVITQKNRGASSARNRAFSFAQGDFIQWLDADDLLAPDKISQQLKYTASGQSTRILFSSAFGKFYFSPQKAKFIPNSLWQDLEPVEWILNHFNNTHWIADHAWLISRRLAEMAGTWDERLYQNQDGEYICRVVAASEKVKFIQEAKCYYRKGNIGTISMKNSYKSAESLLLAAHLCINYLKSLEDSERAREACLKLLENKSLAFYPEKHELIQKANDMARELGGNLSPPSERFVYFLIRKMFGWKMAKNVKNMVLKAKLASFKIQEILC